MANEFNGVPVEPNPHSTDTFVDEALSFEMVNDVIRITFASAKMAEGVPPSPMQLVVVGRLLMGVAPAQRLAIGLFDYLKRQGHDPASILGSLDEKPH